MEKVWTEKNLKALQLVIDNHIPPREACEELQMSYHAIYQLLFRSRLRYFFLTKDPLLIKEMRADAKKLFWLDFKKKYKHRHIYTTIIRDIYISSPEYLDKLTTEFKDKGGRALSLKTRISEVTWRCPKCDAKQQVQSNNMVCSKC